MEDTRLQIEKDMEDGEIVEKRRNYLGMSGAGHSCARYLWYQFRWSYIAPICKRRQRIFDRGHMEEPRVLDDLKNCGYDVDSAQHTMFGLADHIKGHCDGVITIAGEKCVLEIKTMKQEKFNVLLKNKMKQASPGYYGQAQVYMQALELKKCLFIVTNKNDEARYYEIVDYDETQADFYSSRLQDILMTEVPPVKIGNADWYECKYCDAREVCHYGEKVNKSCRTCSSIILEDKGIWRCAETNKELSDNEQLEYCEEYDALTSISD